MTGVWLRALIHWCSRCIVGLLLLAAARMGWVAWQMRGPKVVFTPVASSDADSTRGGPLSALGVEKLRSQLAPNVPSQIPGLEMLGTAGTPMKPARSQVFLIVNVTPDRSEVIVNGINRGQTPWLGEVSCQSGGKLTVVVMPPKGMPKTFERPCDRREIRID